MTKDSKSKPDYIVPGTQTANEIDLDKMAAEQTDALIRRASSIEQDNEPNELRFDWLEVNKDSVKTVNGTWDEYYAAVERADGKIHIEVKGKTPVSGKNELDWGSLPIQLRSKFQLYLFQYALSHAKNYPSAQIHIYYDAVTDTMCLSANYGELTDA